jgi:phosphohistidine phosphatase
LKSLIVLRHGKSDWSSGATSDHDRPLKKRGRRAAACVGRFLSSTNQAPDLVLTSSALRARGTAEIAVEAGTWDVELRVLRELYQTHAPYIVEMLRELPFSIDTVLLVNHEPTCSTLIAHLTGGPSPGFPTAAAARIDFETDAWLEVRPGRGDLAWLVLPRHLEAFEEG